MKETILLFHVPDKKKLLKLEMALFPLHVKLRLIQPEEYSQPLGVLAGMPDVVPSDEVYTGDDLPDTMIIFAFFNDTRLNQALTALKKSNAGPLHYKAVLTPTNQYWTALECFAEISREHEAMAAYRNK